MGKKKLNFISSFFLPLIFFLVLCLVLFRPFILKGLVPIPGDILLGHYYPWKDEIWQGRLAGYPLKNFIIYDGIRQTFPWRLLAIEQLKSGKWPLWNPYNLSGTPLLANIQTAAFYPFNFLFFVLPEIDAWSWYVFLQPVLAGLFTYFFLRTINLGKRASLLGGVCYGFNLMMMNHLEFGIDGHTALWLPLGLGAINKIQSSGEKKWVGVLTAAVSMTLLGGYPPPAIYNLLILGAYLFLKIRPIFSRKILLTTLGLALAFGLTAPQTLPAFELGQKVVREEIVFGASSGYFFFPIENLIMIIAPDFFGHPSTNNFFSRVYHTDNQSIGIVGFVLMVYGLLTFFKSKETKFWTLLAVFPILIMVESPLGKSLKYLPLSVFSQITPMRMNWIVVFSFSVLAGIGLNNLLVFLGSKSKNSFFKFGFPIFLVWEIFFLLWVGTFIFLEAGQREIAQKNLILPSFLIICTSLLLGTMIAFPKLTTIAATLIPLLSGVELVRQGIKYNPFIDKSLIFPKTEIMEKIMNKDRYRTITTNQETLPANSNIPYHLSMVDGYASIYDNRYGQMLKIANYNFPITNIKNYDRVVFQTEHDSQIIDLLGVKYALSSEKIDSPEYRLKWEKGKTKLYENLKVFPKAFFVQNFAVGKTDLEIINLMLKADLRKTVVLEKIPEPIIKENFDSTSQSVKMTKYLNGEAEIEVFTPQPAILVLNDAYDSGWKAIIGNTEAEILRADYDLRAIAVPAGKNKINFVYRPKSFIYGIGVALLSAFLGLVVIKKIK